MKILAPLLTMLIAIAIGRATAQANVATPTAPAYAIGVGDQLNVQVIGEAAVSQLVAVADDGCIGLPLVGSIHVAGDTPSEAAVGIASSLRKYFRDPQVSVAVATQGQMTVLVLGNVKDAGKYLLRHGAHVSDALASAGGLATTSLGTLPAARLVLGDGTVKSVPLEAVLRHGDVIADAELSDRAALYVTGATQFNVEVLGAVDAPGTISVSEGDRLSIAIAKAGNGVNSNADLNHILVTRTEPNGTTASHPVDLYRALEQGDRTYDPRLRKGDVIFVPVASKTHGALSNGLYILKQLVGF